jgi:hypothetical protein
MNNLINSKVFEILSWQQERVLLMKTGLLSSEKVPLVPFFRFLEIKLDGNFRNLEIAMGTEAAERYPYFQQTINIVNMVSSIY